jgi:hypothetical protein
MNEHELSDSRDYGSVEQRVLAALEIDPALNLPRKLLRQMRMRQLIVDALRAIPRDEFDWLFAPVIGNALTAQERFRSTGHLVDISLRMASVYAKAIESQYAA